jgi:hypothetical protein
MVGEGGCDVVCKQVDLVAHYCPVCNMVVAYRTPLDRVKCERCGVDAIPEPGQKVPRSRTS